MVMNKGDYRWVSGHTVQLSMLLFPQILALTYQAASTFSWFDFQQENLDHSKFLFLTKNNVLLYDHLTYSPGAAANNLCKNPPPI